MLTAIFRRKIKNKKKSKDLLLPLMYMTQSKRLIKSRDLTRVLLFYLDQALS